MKWLFGCPPLIVVTVLILTAHANGQDDVQQSDTTLPSVEEAVEKYIEAIGGEMPLHGIESMKLEATFDGLGNRGNGKLMMSYHEGCWHYDFQLDEGRFTYQFCRDGSAWQTIDDVQREMTAVEKVRFGEMVPRVVNILTWLDYDGEIEVKGIEEVRGRQCVQLEFRPSGGDPLQRFFDSETGLLHRIVYQREAGDGEWYLSDYQEIEGILIPMKREQFFSGTLAYHVINEKIGFNEKVDERLFDRPVAESGDDQ